MKFLTFFFMIVSGLALQARAQQRLCEQVYFNNAGETQLTFPSLSINGIVAGGNIYSKATNKFRRYFMRIGNNCDTTWVRVPSSNFNLIGDALTSLDGNYFFSGVEALPNIDEHFLEKFSPSGNLLWRKKYILPLNSSLAKFIQLPDSGFFMLGYDNAFPQQCFLLRTDKHGNQTGIKIRKIPLPGPAGAGDILHTKDGNLLIYGMTRQQRGWVYKLNLNGDSLQFKEIDISSRPDIFSRSNEIVATADSGFVAIVTSVSPYSNTYPDSVSFQNVIKLDKNLNIVWRYKHPVTPGYDLNFTGITELQDGSVIIMSSGLSINANANYELLRFSKTGQLKQTLPFTSGLCQQLALSEGVYMGDSTVYIVGWCYNNNVRKDAYAARLSIGQVVTDIKENISARINLGQSYPNPTASEAIIPYFLPKNYIKASILIQEIATGREIRKYALKRNSSSLAVDVSSLSNGLYSYSLVVDEKPVATRKLAVMK